MTDDATTTATFAAGIPNPTGDSAPSARLCPWCSQILPADAEVRCPHCHANLVSDVDTRLPGLTEVEAPSATKARRAEAPKRSKLLSWISGDIDDDPSPLSGPSADGALAPPPRDVRREMLRLQLQSEGLTVTPDGSIELPTQTAAAASAEAATATVPTLSVTTPDTTAPDPMAGAAAVATSDDAGAPAEIRKAS